MLQSEFRDNLGYSVISCLQKKSHWSFHWPCKVGLLRASDCLLRSRAQQAESPAWVSAMSHLHLRPGDSSARLLPLRELHSEPLACQKRTRHFTFPGLWGFANHLVGPTGAFEDTGPQLPVQISEQQPRKGRDDGCGRGQCREGRVYTRK